MRTTRSTYLHDSLDNSAVIDYPVEEGDGPEDVSAGLLAAAQTARNNSVAPWCYVTVTLDSENNIVITVMPDAPDLDLSLSGWTNLEAEFPVSIGVAATHIDRTDCYYNESWQVLEERRQRKLVEDADVPCDVVRVQHLWDLRYIDSPVLRWRDADADTQTGPSGMEETLYFTTDANGNVTSLVGQCDGLVHERYQYDAYGKRTIIGASSTASWYGNTRGFAGYMMEKESSTLLSSRRRFYDAYLGTWLQPDPIPANNAYVYCLGSPTDHTDPSGLTPGGLALTLESVASTVPAWVAPLLVDAVPAMVAFLLVSPIISGAGHEVIAETLPEELANEYRDPGAPPYDHIHQVGSEQYYDDSRRRQEQYNVLLKNNRDRAKNAGQGASNTGNPCPCPDPKNAPKSVVNALERHHQLPTEFKRQFKDAGLEIEDY